MALASAVRGAIISATVLAAGPGLSRSAAQELSNDIGYVETVSGRVVAMAHGAPVLADVSDVISDQTRFDLLGNSELNLCYYRIGRFITVKGPARIIISKDGITVLAGSPVEISKQTCTVVQASKSQGGIAARGVPSKK
jgi:hypothetical protein